MSPVTLHVLFGGLGLFVQDGQADVLMPPTGSGAYGSVPQHAAKLVIPSQFLRDGNAGPVKDYDMNQKCLVLPGKDTTPSVSGKLSDSIFDVCPYESTGVDDDLLHPNTPTTPGNELRLNARLTFLAGNAKGYYADGRFTVRDESRHLSHFVRWAIPLDGPELTVWLNDLTRPLNNKTRIDLKAVNNTILLVVLHEPIAGHSTPGGHPPGTPASHVAAYYGLLNGSSDPVIPVYEGNIPDGPSGHAHDEMTQDTNIDQATVARLSGLVRLFGGDPVTCLCAQC